MEEEKNVGLEESRRGRSRKRKDESPASKIPVAKIAGAAAGALLLAGGIGGFWYWNEARKYETCFFPGTQINGMDVSGKTVDEVKSGIVEGLNGYQLTVTGREGMSETISGEDIGLYAEFDGSLENMIAVQVPMEWWKHKNAQTENRRIDTMVVYDEAKFDETVSALEFMDKGNMKEPENAKLSDYIEATKSYEIVPAYAGTEVIPDSVKKAISEAVMGLSEEVNLEEAGCYTKPAVETDDESLVALAAELNKYVGAVVTHTFGDKQAVLDGNTVSQWLSVNGQTVVLDEAKVTEYVTELANTYDTAYKNKTLKTSYGPTVTISRGNYGWRINKPKETAAVLEILKSGEQQTREPEYTQKAASRGEHDYGGTYVEINLTAQHLYFYKEGELLVESDFVSGNQSRGWSTPGGAYPLTYKQRNATLKGEGYSTPVSYWMPFNGGIGMHDADWRASFGGSIYKTNGSHGCINLPPKVAKTIYENISAGMPVLCYHLEGTESKKATDSPKETKPAASTAHTSPAATAPAPSETAPAGPVGPGGETPDSPAATQPSAPTVPETPVSPAETTPAMTAGGDEEHFGPGFVKETETEPTERPVGPGY